MKKILGHALRLALAAACLTYALWGVDFPKLLEVFGTFHIAPMAATALFVVFTSFVPGARLSFLTEKRLDVFQGLRAVLLGLGLNNILPARLGEAAKALYIKQRGPMSMSRALEAVFWERFFDLNALLVLGLFVVLLLGKAEFVYPMLGVVGGLWLFLGLVRFRPKAAHALLRLLPMEKLRVLFGEILLLLEAKCSPGFMGVLAGYTVCAWTLYTGTFFLGLNWVADLGLSPFEVLSVFAVTTIGFAIPSAPGGMGVYEAAFVLSLGWFGVDKEEAFAVGFMLHMLQYIPITLLGLGVMALSGQSLRTSRREAERLEDGG